jgi:hypothetical protein
MSLMPIPYVNSATIKNNKVELSVELDASDSGTYVEISGSATQTGGAFANFYDIQQVPTASSDPGEPDKRYVSVSAHPLPPSHFRDDQDVTAVIRVAKVWLTVLGRGYATSQEYPPPPPAQEGTKWDQVRKVSEITGDSPNPAAS